MTYKLYEEDCLSVLPTLEDDSVDLIITDPPYFLPVNSYVGKRGEGYHHRTLADTSILKGYFERVFQELDRILKPDGTYYVFCDAQSYPIFYQVMFPYCKYVRLLIWDKKVSYNGYTWRHQHELIAWGEKEESKRVPTGDGDIIRCRGVLQKDRNHPAEKPVEIISRLLQKHEDYKIVLDPYMGSGTTGVASTAENKDFIGVELDPTHYSKAKLRMDNSLNNKPLTEF
jgi:site-specific DNA-methyltransferase (adenine-specific)